MNGNLPASGVFTRIYYAERTFLPVRRAAEVYNDEVVTVNYNLPDGKAIVYVKNGKKRRQYTYRADASS